MDLEELELDEELDEIERQWGGSFYPFPAVTIMDKNIYFNIPFSTLVGDAKYIAFSTSTNYVIMQPRNCASPTAFKIRHFDKSGKIVIHPAALKEKKIKKGSYKIYKYKDGWAFKRYEPLEAFS